MEKIYYNLEEENYIKTNDQCILLSQIKDNYLDFVLTYKSIETYKCYLGHLNIIVDYFKIIQKCKYDLDITKEMIHQFIKFQRKKELSNATINKRINVFKRALSYSNSTLNLSKIKTLKETYVTFEYLRQHELELLIEYVDTSNMSMRNKLIVFLMLETGIRRKEILKIDHRNIDFENQIIFLSYTKTNTPRIVCYDKYTKKYLDEYLKTFDKTNKYLFDISVTALDSIFKRIKAQLNFPKFSPYVLRHTYATIIVNNDGNIEMLKNTMGHTRLSTTQRYIHYNKQLIRKSYEKSFKLN